MKPLQDVRIIAVEQYGAGPWATVHLADLGADVIKIEDPRVGRRRRPLRAAVRRRARTRCSSRPSTAASAACRWTWAREPAGPSSRSWCATPTPSTPTCAATYRRRSASRYDDLKQLNPRIVCCSLTGFGMTGPRTAGAGLRLHPAGAGRLDGADRRAGRPADQVRACRWSTTPAASSPRSRCWPASHAARRDGVGMDCDVASTTPRSSMLTYPAHLAPATPAISPTRTAALRAPVAGAVPGLRGQGRLDRRGLRQGEVLAAAGPGHRAPGVGRPDPRYATFAGAAGAHKELPRRAGGDLPAPHGRSSGSPCCYPAVDPVRPDQRRAEALSRKSTPRART